MRETTLPTARGNSWILAGALILSCLVAVSVLYLSSPLPLALFPMALLLVYATPRLITNPFPVLAGLLLVAVNLNFFRLGESALNADVLLSSLLVWVLLIRLALKGRSIGSSPVEKAYLVYLAFTLVSVILSISPAQSVKRWGRDLEYLILFTLLTHEALSTRHRDLLLKAIVWSSVLPCLAGYLGLYLGIPALLGNEAPIGGGESVPRISGTAAHPVTLSLYLAVVGTLTLALLLDGSLMRLRLLIPLFIFQLVSLYFTYGRTGWAVFVICAIAYFWFTGRRKVLLLALPFVAVALWKFVPSFFERWDPVLASTDENSLLWRIGLWIHAFGVFLARPIFGSGPGTFLEHVAYLKGYTSHQTWIGRLVESGILGTLALLVLLLVLGRALWTRRREVGAGKNLVLEATLAVWVGLMVSSLVADAFGIPSVILYFWVLAALSLRSRGLQDSSQITRFRSSS
jgi:O-antigen ligase